VPVTGLEIGSFAEASRIDDASLARSYQYQTEVPGARVHRHEAVQWGIAGKRQVEGPPHAGGRSRAKL
jgi:hypothetical protein